MDDPVTQVIIELLSKPDGGSVWSWIAFGYERALSQGEADSALNAAKGAVAYLEGLG